MWTVIYLVFVYCGHNFIRCEFFICHNDPRTDPGDGLVEMMHFTWLGTLQYIHVKNGTPHFFRVPRVLLISHQFVLSTASDAALIPEGYALGNVVFGEYDRDEKECGITREMLLKGVRCESAALMIPVADVLLHPEYKNFGATNSIALLKLLTPVKSSYMLPVCLPFKNFVSRRLNEIPERIFHVDFTSDVPRNVIDEEKYVSRVSILPRELCSMRVGDSIQNVSRLSGARAFTRMMCTSGCGFHSGAPSLVHEHTGHWSIVSLAQGWSPCPDPLRSERSHRPPRHTLLYHYVPWITRAIVGQPVGSFSSTDPFGFAMPKVVSKVDHTLITHSQSWNGRWWMGGLRCFDRGEATAKLFRFYHEIFEVTPNDRTDFAYYLELTAGHQERIVCVKIGFPFKSVTDGPLLFHIDTASIKLRVPVTGFVAPYRFQVEAWAVNATESELTVSLPKIGADGDTDVDYPDPGFE